MKLIGSERGIQLRAYLLNQNIQFAIRRKPWQLYHCHHFTGNPIKNLSWDAKYFCRATSHSYNSLPDTTARPAMPDQSIEIY